MEQLCSWILSSQEALVCVFLFLDCLLDSHALRQIPRLVYVAASSYGYVVGEELQGDYFEDG